MKASHPAAVPRWRVWLVAARPWSLPASTMPVFFGTVLAVAVGGAAFHAGRFAVALLAMVLLHTAANMLSDVFDDRRGLDTDVTPVSGALVRGWLKPRALLTAAAALGTLGVALGIGLALRVGPALWWIGGVGVLIGAAYSLLKAHALGDLAVFLNFGLLGAAGAWTVQAGEFSIYPVIAAVPLALLVVAILHANNWRDADGDRQHRVHTLAAHLGDRGSQRYYGLLLFVPFAWIAAMVLAPRLTNGALTPLPFTLLIVFLAIPQAATLWRRARERKRPRGPLDFLALDGATAQLNLLFGALCTVAILVDLAVRRLTG